MKRTTLVSAEEGTQGPGGMRPAEHGSLKVFFSYAPCSGTTAAMLDEARGLTGSGRDVFVAGADDASALDIDQLLKRRPDVVVLENLALANPAGSRNRTRYRDAEELLRAGIDVYATLRVSDLQNEQDRVRALGVEVPPDPVPDYMLYGARQLEFVDIDPGELVVRAKASGRVVPSHVLNELRILALRCVSEYASNANAEQGGDPVACAPDTLGRLVVAYVEDGQAPGRVLLEATRLAAASHAELEVVSVRRESHSGAAAARAEAEHAELEEQVEAMGLALVTFFGDDPVEIVRDYVRSQGASDIVLARHRLSVARRALLPLVPPFERRVASGLARVSVHLVADETPASSNRLPVLGLRRAADVSLRGLLTSALCVAAAFGAVRLLQLLGFGETASYVLFLGAVLAAAGFTRSYVCAVAACVFGFCTLDFFFLRPYLSLAVDHRASLLTLVAFGVVGLASSAALAHAGRAAERAAANERRTQVLFDLDRSFLYAHGTVEAVDVALSSVVRLFDRSAALFLADPFSDAPRSGHDRRVPTVRAVPGDVDAAAFTRLTEQAVAHWVFANGEEAGNGTDTHGESDLYYLPLEAQEGIEGVLVVSARRPLSLAERSFLDMVAGQASLALERQSLAAKHRDDLRSMQVTDIRSAFSAAVAAAARTAAGTVHAVADLLVAVPEEDRAWREALARSASEEAARSRIMTDRMQAVLDAPVGFQCDVRAEVSRAVGEVREGLSGKVIDLVPGDPTPPVTADAALVRAATRLLLEAATSYVGPHGIVQVSVASYPDRVCVIVADDRAADAAPSRSAAFELSSKAGHVGEPVFEEARAAELLASLRARPGEPYDPQAPLAALCRAMRLPEEAARTGAEGERVLNRQRILRFDRLEYGLYMAALAVRVHGGTIKQRYRLGGGVVVTFTLPRE